MKTILFTLTMTLIAFASFGTTSSYACGMCGKSDSSHEMKPCEKSMNGEKKPCEKCMGKKHDHNAEPCKICQENDKRFETNKEMTKGEQYKTEKGTYHVQSRGMVDDGYND